jgi:hypothetical protein
MSAKVYRLDTEQAEQELQRVTAEEWADARDSLADLLTEVRARLRGGYYARSAVIIEAPIDDDIPETATPAPSVDAVSA